MREPNLIRGLAAAVALSAATTAFAVPMYAPNSLDRNNPGSTGPDRLVMFDSDNPEGFTVVGSMGVDNVGFGGMEFDNQGRLWAYAGFYKSTGGAASGLYSVNINTGLATLVGEEPRLFIEDLAWNPADGQMYGVRTQNHITHLYTIDLDNGALTHVGDINGLNEKPNVNGLAFDSTGAMYLLDNRNSTLYGGNGLNVDVLYSLDTDPDDGGEGQLTSSQGITVDWSRDNQGWHGYVAQGEFPNFLSLINRFNTDGSGYVYGESFGDNILVNDRGLPPVQPGDIAIMPTAASLVPEPTTLGLAAMAAPLLLRRRRA